MASCINKSLGEYQSLKNMAGIPETTLDFWCQYYLTKFDRFPNLDELPNVDSEKYLKEKLNIKEVGNSQVAEVSTLLNLTGEQSFEQAIIKLNNIHRDLEIMGFNIGNGKFFVEIKHRPTAETIKNNFELNYESTPESGRVVLVNALSKLQQYYGINIIPIDSSDFEYSEELKNLPDQSKMAKAFVFNGNIYVNTDLAELESPIHEMLHIFLGGMRYTNPDQYINIISKLKNVDLETLQSKFGNKSQNDLLEEYFVTEFAKFLSGYNTEFDSMKESDIQYLLYNITRNIDSVLMGETTVKLLPAEDIIKGSLLDLAIKTKSEIIKQTPLTIMDLATIHRKTANIKSKLLEDGELIQKCE